MGLIALAAALPLFGSPPGGPYLAALDCAGIGAILACWRTPRLRPSGWTWPPLAFLAVSLVTLVPPPFLPPAWNLEVLTALARGFSGVASWHALYTWRAGADLVLGVGLFWATRRAFSGLSIRPLAMALGAGLGVSVLLGLADHAQLLSLDAFRPEPNARLQSLFFLSGWFSEYLVIAAPLGIAAIVSMRTRARHLALPFLALTGSALLLTQQRGAWLAATVQLVFCAAILAPHRLQSRRSWVKLGWAVSATVALTGAIAVGSGAEPSSLVQRARSAMLGFSTRAPIWVDTIDLIEKRPLLGWGLGSFSQAYDLQRPRGTEGSHPFRGTAHNLYLHTAAERGLLGLIALAVLAGSAVVGQRKAALRKDVFALALASSGVGFAVYGLFQYMLYLRNIHWLAWILLGCTAVAAGDQEFPLLTRLSKYLILIALALVPLLAFFPQAIGGVPVRDFGWHEVEHRSDGSLRWTEGFAAARLPWTGETLVMSLANGHPKPFSWPVRVTVTVNGKKLATLRIVAGWEEHRFDLGPQNRDWVLLTLRVEPTFRPFREFLEYPDLYRSNDVRSLGVAVKDVYLESIAIDSSPRRKPPENQSETE